MAISENLEGRQARLARNQSLFREVNERVNDLHALFVDRAPVENWVCECANESCDERVALTYAEYETIRATPTRFPVTPRDSHVFLDVERVVARNERFWVVEKVEVGADVAVRFDPRSQASPVE